MTKKKETGRPTDYNGDNAHEMNDGGASNDLPGLFYDEKPRDDGESTREDKPTPDPADEPSEEPTGLAAEANNSSDTGTHPGSDADPDSSPDVSSHEPDVDSSDPQTTDLATDKPQAAEPEPDTSVAELQGQYGRLQDQHLRLAAEFDNFRKRSADKLSHHRLTAQVDLLQPLLDPIDDLQRVADADGNASAVVEGVQLVRRKLFKVLEDVGVEVLASQGDHFDPNVMEAMMTEPTESEEDDDTVHQVFQRGYTLKGFLVRPARVSVLKTE